MFLLLGYIVYQTKSFLCCWTRKSCLEHPDHSSCLVICNSMFPIIISKSYLLLCTTFIHFLQTYLWFSWFFFYLLEMDITNFFLLKVGDFEVCSDNLAAKKYFHWEYRNTFCSYVCFCCDVLHSFAIFLLKTCSYTW